LTARDEFNELLEELRAAAARQADSAGSPESEPEPSPRRSLDDLLPKTPLPSDLGSFEVEPHAIGPLEVRIVGDAAASDHRYREADRLPVGQVCELVGLTKDRREVIAKTAKPPRRGPLTQGSIGRRAGLAEGPGRHRVQQVEGLLAAGWDLPESWLRFPADRLVQLPTVEKFLQMRDSEHPN
jgi:hypothetical protein